VSPRLFIDINLSESTQKALRKMGFTRLTPIQSEAIPLLLQGRDVIGQAQTGTGKTAAYGVPMIEVIDGKEPYIQGLVITPTRELAEQVSGSLKSLARYKDVNILVIHGGDKLSIQLELLNKQVQVVVGTPGRLVDLVRKRAIELSKVRVVALDEADKMLEMGFIRDIEYLLSKTPYVRQTSLWSATITPEVLELSTRYMRHPRKVLVSQEEVAQTNVDQYYIKVFKDQKKGVLEKLIRDFAPERAVIFCNTRESTEELAGILSSDGYLVASIHGGYTQSQRDEAIEYFKLRKVKYLVSTDLTGRGLDISGIPYIINYEVPEDPEVYFHRIGRTARIGESGTSVTLVEPEEEPSFQNIIGMTETKIKELKL
jgi:ATP-dependent RNA helicase DeaD